MIDDVPLLSSELRVGRRALEGMAGVELLQDWTWNATDNRWILHVRLSIDVSDQTSIPATTDWWIIAEPTYPLGKVKFYPAKDKGIQQTFPHQSYNGLGLVEHPWRSGSLCLDPTVRRLGPYGYDIEPLTAYERLRWCTARALAWLYAASVGKLSEPGDPFELPDFPLASGVDTTVVLSEGTESFDFWSNCADMAGLVDLVPLKPGIFAVTCFRSVDGQKLFIPQWGRLVAMRSGERVRGMWLRLPSVPSVQPWQAPTTWGELRQVSRSQNLLLDKLIGSVSKHLRDGKAHIALLGFPMPMNVGDALCQFHWQAIQLPVLSRNHLVRHGHRPNELGYRARDRETILADHVQLSWLRSENWHAEQIASRGVLPSILTKRRVLVIGSGAVGSILTELLVRSGVSAITVIDSDIVMAGNLVRHTLGTMDVRRPKATALAERLNGVTPHANVEAFSQPFPPTEDDSVTKMRQHDLIIDCTGSDEVLAHLERFPWDGSKYFVSASLGVRAQRLFCFTAQGRQFPFAIFQSCIQPWLDEERKETPVESFPREGVGCWHPVFPARADDIWLLASITIKHIEAFIAQSNQQPCLKVVEQQYEHGLFSGIRTIISEALNA